MIESIALFGTMALCLLYGFAPFYLLKRFKQPFEFLKMYIIIFQLIIIYCHLITRDNYKDSTITLFQATLQNPSGFWYVLLYILISLLLFILYLSSYGKKKIGADTTGVLSFINLLLSWGIIFAWLGFETSEIYGLILLVIRLIGQLAILLPQFLWTDIFGNHPDPYSNKILESLKKEHYLSELIPAYEEKLPQKRGDQISADEDLRYSLELVAKGSVIHTMTCQVFIEKTDNGKKREGWYFPFNSYEEAVEYGSKLENRNRPKTCGKCKPWIKYSKPKIVISKLTVNNETIDHVFLVIKSWIIVKGGKIEEEKEHFFLKGVVASRSSYGVEYSREIVEIALSQLISDVSIEIKFWIEHPYQDTYAGYRMNEEDKRSKKVVDELKEYITESTKRFDTRRTINYKDAFRNLRKPRPLLAQVSEFVEEKPVTRSTTYWLLVLSISLIMIYIGLFFGLDLTPFSENIIELILTYGVAIGLIYWTYLSDKKEKEPIICILLLFCWGILSGLIAAPIYSKWKTVTTIPPYFFSPFIEEAVKALGLYVFLTHPRTRGEFNSPLDGIIYGFSVGMGFYASENFLYYMTHDFGTLIIRILLCWGHGLWTAIVGLWIAVNRHYRGYNKPNDIFPGLLVAVTMHLLWNIWGDLGKIGGYMVWYQALFQYAYFRKIINEAKSDEFFSGVDKIVLSPLDKESAKKYSRTYLVLGITLLLGSVSVYALGYGLVKSTSDKWVKFDFMDFSFEYPERLWHETTGEFEGDAATEGYGEIWFGNYRGRPREALVITYGSYGKLGYWRSGYSFNLIKGSIVLGHESEFLVNDHTGLYRNFTLVRNGEEFNCVLCGWSCKEIWRVFFVQYYTIKDDSYITWEKIIDSFKCH